MTTERKPSRPTCTDHCSDCGRHFHGLRAFDFHHKDTGCAEPDECYSSKGRKQLQVWAEDGWCRLSDGSYEDGKLVNYFHPVTIWQVYSEEEDEPRST